MQLSDFDFDLPERLIATRPARPRTSARLLVARGDRIEDRRVSDLIDEFRPGDRLILNNTKVISSNLSHCVFFVGLRQEPSLGNQAKGPPNS